MELKFFLIWVMQVVFLALILASGHARAVTEADVFDWWDGGIITPEQAEEMLTLLDEGNESEACLLAQVYAQEECESEMEADNGNRNSSGPKKTAPKTRKNETAQTSATRQKQKARPSLVPHGYVMWKARFDSAGQMESHREELQVSFYRYTLRLGSQELLTYKNDGSEAHFGEISTRELHSHFPLDTLWGAAALYPLGKFHLAALLDTSRAVQARSGYAFNKEKSIEGIFWYKHGSTRKNVREVHSAALQTKFDFGKISGWWEHGQSAPLIKVELANSATLDESNKSKTPQKTSPPKASFKNATELSWKTTAYYHEDSVPTIARLSSTILKSRLWGSQTISITMRGFANTRVTANARLINPLHSDSLSTRLKAAIQSGPDALRGTFSVTCIEASENCHKTDWQGGISSHFLDQWTFDGLAKTRYTRGKGLDAPRIELGVQYQDSPRNTAKLKLIAPNSTPAGNLQIQNEVQLHADFLDLSLVMTFRETPKTNLHPSHGSVTARVRF